MSLVAPLRQPTLHERIRALHHTEENSGGFVVTRARSRESATESAISRKLLSTVLCPYILVPMLALGITFGVGPQAHADDRTWGALDCGKQLVMLSTKSAGYTTHVHVSPSGSRSFKDFSNGNTARHRVSSAYTKVSHNNATTGQGGAVFLSASQRCDW